MNTQTLNKVLRVLKRILLKRKACTTVGAAEQTTNRPFKALVGALLSLRTKDQTTEAACRRLLARAPTPAALAALSPEEIEQLIYPVGFYRTKARYLRETCMRLITEHAGEVPNSIDALLRLPGVGRKTANFVLTAGFKEYGICVDTHVHRITNRWGYVSTRTPIETEFALRKKLPKRHWKSYNQVLVSFGQKLCLPLSPWCSKCPVARYCPRLGVNRSR